jgi:hypothetical protein
MLRVFIFAAGFLAVPLGFAQSIPSVGVFLDFDSVPGAASVDVMKKEVNSLLKGISLNWRLVSENHGDEPFNGLVVLRFHGKCKVESWAQPGPGTGTRTLGTTSVVNGRVLPYSEVECDEVRRALAYLTTQVTQREQQKALGRALGRVVAHEIYHVLAHTTSHAAHGLAKAAESLDELISDAVPMVFRAEDTAAMKQGARGAAADPTPAAAPGTTSTASASGHPAGRP